MDDFEKLFFYLIIITPIVVLLISCCITRFYFKLRLNSCPFVLDFITVNISFAIILSFPILTVSDLYLAINEKHKIIDYDYGNLKKKIKFAYKFMHYFFYFLEDFWLPSLLFMSSFPKCKNIGKCFKSESILGILKILILFIICIALTIIFGVVCYIFLPEPKIEKVINKTQGWDGFYFNLRNLIFLIPIEMFIYLMMILLILKSLSYFTCFNAPKYCCEICKDFCRQKKHYYYHKLGLFEVYKDEETYKSKLLKINSYLSKNHYSFSYIKENINMNFPDDFPYYNEQINNKDDGEKYDENKFYQDIAAVSQIFINNERKRDLKFNLIDELKKENEKCCCCKFRCFCLPACLIDPIFGAIILFTSLAFVFFEGFYYFTYFRNIIKIIEKSDDDLEKKNILTKGTILIFGINYVYYFVVFYVLLKRGYFLAYYPYYNGKYNEIGFLNLIKTILNFFFVAQYLVYFPAFAHGYELNIRNYFALLDFGINAIILTLLKSILPLLILIILEQCRCTRLMDFRIYYPQAYHDNIIVKKGKEIAEENGIYIDDDYDDQFVKETRYLMSTSEDD